MDMRESLDRLKIPHSRDISGRMKRPLPRGSVTDCEQAGPERLIISGLPRET